MAYGLVDDPSRTAPPMSAGLREALGLRKTKPSRFLDDQAVRMAELSEKEKLDLVNRSAGNLSILKPHLTKIPTEEIKPLIKFMQSELGTSDGNNVFYDMIGDPNASSDPDIGWLDWALGPNRQEVALQEEWMEKRRKKLEDEQVQRDINARLLRSLLRSREPSYDEWEGYDDYGGMERGRY